MSMAEEQSYRRDIAMLPRALSSAGPYDVITRRICSR